MSYISKVNRKCCVCFYRVFTQLLSTTVLHIGCDLVKIHCTSAFHVTILFHSGQRLHWRRNQRWSGGHISSQECPEQQPYNYFPPSHLHHCVRCRDACQCPGHLGIPLQNQEKASIFNFHGKPGSSRPALCHLGAAENSIPFQWQQLDLWRGLV